MRRRRRKKEEKEKKEEEELKERIDMMVSTKFQINMSTNGRDNYILSDMGTNQPTDQQTKVSKRGAWTRLKITYQTLKSILNFSNNSSFRLSKFSKHHSPYLKRFKK
jgi:hypothetical protein